MSSHGLTKENIVMALPVALQKDESVVALAEAIADVLSRRPAEIDRIRIYPAIDQLDEQLLDILAYDFKVDWWDADYSVEEKRQTLKDSWRVHKRLGTKAAVETAISAIYPNTKVLEWFEYGGEPYHFRLDINITDDSIDSEKQRRVLKRLNYYKSLRSHNDGVTYFVEAAPAIARAGGSAPGLWEAVSVPLTLPVPIIKPVAIARTGAHTGLHEAFTACMEIPLPILQSVAAARLGAVASMTEVFSSEISFPDVEPPRGVARVRTAVAAAITESRTTGPLALPVKVLTATAHPQAKGAVASAQETARTQINL